MKSNALVGEMIAFLLVLAGIGIFFSDADDPRSAAAAMFILAGVMMVGVAVTYLREVAKHMTALNNRDDEWKEVQKDQMRKRRGRNQ